MSIHHAAVRHRLSESGGPQVVPYRDRDSVLGSFGRIWHAVYFDVTNSFSSAQTLVRDAGIAAAVEVQHAKVAEVRAVFPGS
jgi:hypothetical protein